MVAVALVGLNLAGAIAAAKNHHVRFSPKVRDTSHFSRTWTSIETEDGRGIKSARRSFVFQHLNGTIEVGRGYGSPRQELERIVLAPPPTTTLQVWSPLIASVLLTILVAVVPRPPSSLPRRSLDSTGDPLLLVRQWGPGPTPRWLIAVSALVGLNLLAALYRQPDPYDERIESPLRSTAELLAGTDGWVEIQPRGNPLVMEPDGFRGLLTSLGGGVVIKPDGSLISASSTDGRDRPVRNRDDRGRHLGTIVYQPDGGIVGYEGKPGEMQGAPHVIRPPLHSFLGMWWPVMASAAITLVAVGILSRQALRRPSEPVTQNECHAKDRPHP